ncbi:MAG: divergent polysaccharide deacetylase family protein [bacterium]
MQWPESDFNFDDHAQKESLKFRVYEILFDYGIRVEWITGDSYHKTVRIPVDLNMLEPYVDLVAKLRDSGAQFLKAETNPTWDEMVIEVAVDGEALFKLTLVQDNALKRIGGKIAIVIDDFGYSFNKTVKEFINLEPKVTLSILPGLSYSRKIAESAFGNHREVMLHLPMEPQANKVKFDEYILLTSMNDTEVRSRVRKAIAAIPHAVGMNNHMGSLATVDEKVVAALMDEVKKTELFFLDSRTNSKTRAFNQAQKMKIPCNINDTFLDNIDEEPYIRQQLYSLAEIATKNGQAIGIGHPRPLTLKVLKQELAVLKKKGYKFVTVSKTVK